MQYNSQVYKRSDGVLDNCLVIKIGQLLPQFVDSKYNILENLSQFEGCKQAYENSFLNHFTENFIQIHDMGHIPYLENLMLGSIEQTECNKNGLNIFITEQLLHTNEPYTRIVFNGKNSYSTVKDGFQHTKNDTIWSPELESVQTFVTKNNLTNVVVNVNFDDVHNIYKDKYSFTLKRNDAILDALNNIYQDMPHSTSIRNTEINTKLWCGNWRYTPHRHLITAFSSLLDTQYSWTFVDPKLNVLNNIWFDIDMFAYKDQILNGLSNLNENPNNIDIATDSIEVDGNIYDSSIRPKEMPAGPNTNEYTSDRLYGNTFCAIVNSSTFAEPFPTYDEKPLNAIFNKRPFVLCGPPGSLALMRKDGFETFGEFWDESYDDELDHKKRLEKIFKLLTEINSWDLQKCQDMYGDMLPVLFRNYAKLKGSIDVDLRSTT